MDTDRPTIIQATALEKRFTTNTADITAYTGIDLHIEQGEFVCIVGPSGCGKTTLLRTLAGLESPSAGTLEVQASQSDHRSVLSMVFQEHGLFPWMSVRENIAFPLRDNSRFKRDEIDAVTDQLLDTVGLTRFCDLYPHQVSGGMRQRASVARSFATDPALLLMDEPFVFVDYQTRLQLHQLLMSIWVSSGATILFVTHDIEEAVLLGDRVLLLTAHPGSIKQEINVDIPRPRDVYTARRDARFVDYVATITDQVRADFSRSDATAPS